ncbi:retropepsin-like aspartic protease family protein [Pseudooceanicola sp. C21-150M6]|uniref:retropepsin-like aspartic protease family protein n=1 Tax=Pseudooceanicola sp. C21-150M6 TaxID=3434355 RepID=UPI003D7FE6EC
MNLAYLVLLLVAVGGWMVFQRRESVGKLLQQGVIWGLIFVGVIAAVGLWGDIRQTVRPSQSVLQSGSISVPQSPDGHFYLTADVNGTPLRFMVDTGATDIVLTRNDAQRVGLKPDQLVYSGKALSANGEVGIAPVVLESVALGPMQDRRVRAMVNSGDMNQSLLGMRYLQRFSEIKIGDRALILTP